MGVAHVNFVLQLASPILNLIAPKAADFQNEIKLELKPITNSVAYVCNSTNYILSGTMVGPCNKMFAIFQVMLGWKTDKQYHETDEVPNPRTIQPKKKIG